MSKATEISNAIKAAVIAEMGEGAADYAEHLTPTFTEERQAKLFESARFIITNQMESWNGVAWIGTLEFNGGTIFVSNDGNGGCHNYHADNFDDLIAARRFAEAIYPDCIDVEIDTLVNALEIVTLVAA